MVLIQLDGAGVGARLYKLAPRHAPKLALRALVERKTAFLRRVVTPSAPPRPMLKACQSYASPFSPLWTLRERRKGGALLWKKGEGIALPFNRSAVALRFALFVEWKKGEGSGKASHQPLGCAVRRDRFALFVEEGRSPSCLVQRKKGEALLSPSTSLEYFVFLKNNFIFVAVQS